MTTYNSYTCKTNFIVKFPSAYKKKFNNLIAEDSLSQYFGII